MIYYNSTLRPDLSWRDGYFFVLSYQSLKAGTLESTRPHTPTIQPAASIVKPIPTFTARPSPARDPSQFFSPSLGQVFKFRQLSFLLDYLPPPLAPLHPHPRPNPPLTRARRSKGRHHGLRPRGRGSPPGLLLPDAALEPDVLAELTSLLRLHGVSAEDLFYKWESYCMRLEVEPSAVTLPALKAFKQRTLDDLEKTNQAAAAKGPERRIGQTPRSVAKGGGGDVFNMQVPPPFYFPFFSYPATARTKGPAGASLKKRALETPSTNRLRSDVPASSLTSRPPADSPMPPDPSRPRAPFAPYPEPRVRLNALADVRKIDYKPLSVKLSEVASALNRRIDNAVALLAADPDIDDSEFGNPTTQSTSRILAVGRISSMKHGNGRRVPLNVSRLPGFSTFPGQVVALRGTNASGSQFVADQVHRLRGDPDAMDADADSDGPDPAPLTVLFASGPYTPDDNLDYEALHAICDKAAQTYADALVLSGPFLDLEHPLIASGDFDLPEDASYDPDTATMTTVFRHLSVKIVPNPRTLFLNEIMLGLSGQDALWELRHEELVVGRVPLQDPPSRLSRYLIDQRHYFPLFPPTDRSKLPKTGTEDGRPPAPALQPFARVVESVLVINPGSLSKRRGAGTYARMILYPRALDAEDRNQEFVPNNVFSRARVDVIKI
ncbi:unnamed protein product [Parascedosporium putredinis]|uniref:DNA polymerase alpha subunit B n=1 Tax=Parascedosporium putredinis TaxID=1442378 RepID=A0A9P1GZ30_9PEZI|nr:unnamed protein product [Parascedosporium putredinis]CAI7990687.1 unnamed protein product [Parascedosporium putredinis]